MLLLVPAVLGGSGCAGHPSHDARIQNMNRVIEEGGYQTRGRPSNGDRFLEQTRDIQR